MAPQSMLTARLQPRPFGNQPAEATLGAMPLYGEREFAELQGFEIDTPAPVLISPRQRYTLLAEVVSTLQAAVPGPGPVLVKLGGGEFRVSLPAELLALQVLLCDEPAAWVERLAREGLRNLACLWPELRTDGFERGDNRLTVGLFHATAPARAAFEAWARGPALARRFQQIEVVHRG